MITVRTAERNLFGVKNMSDLIKREDVEKAIRSICDLCGEKKKNNGVMCGACNLDSFIREYEDIPSAEPERKKGEWIEISWSEPDPNGCCTSYAIQSAKCSICGKYHTTPYLYRLDYFPYCPNCGAEMRGDQ